jgi:THO complex subunit 1 transcription elongation factor
MLRTCNQLLRRLSKGHNAVLCGRILIFLARLLPLSDRSGINLQVRLGESFIVPVFNACAFTLLCCPAWLAHLHIVTNVACSLTTGVRWVMMMPAV